MSDHDFEKRVQHKLDELKFTPSDAVWSRVESNLRRDKPRRRGWLWIPVVAGLLATGGYFLLPTGKLPAPASTHFAENQPGSTNPGNASADQEKVTINTPDAAESKQNQRKTNNNIEPGTTGKDSPIANDFKAGNPRDYRPGANNYKKTDRGVHKPGANDLSVKKPLAGKPDEDNAETGTDIGQPFSKSKNADLQNSDSEKRILKTDKPQLRPSDKEHDQKKAEQSAVLTDNTNIKTTDVDGKQPLHNNANVNVDVAQRKVPAGAASDSLVVPVDLAAVPSVNDTLNNDILSAVAVVSDENDTSVVAALDDIKEQVSALDSSSSAPIQLKGINKNKKWQFGVSITGGMSKVSEGAIGDLLKNASVADAVSREQLASNNFLFLPVTAGVPPPVPSTVKPGIAFSIGGYAGRQLTKRISFTVGLGYLQYNNIIQVGYRVDSSMLVNNVDQVANVSRYYRADQKSKFSNRYHFVEVPLQFHTRLNKGLKTPLLWDAGITVAQMFASRALLFDSGTGVYYEDNTRYNKTQFALNTGFSIGVFSRSKLPVTIGPSIRYHITPLYKDNIGGRKQLLSATLDLRMQLYKK